MDTKWLKIEDIAQHLDIHPNTVRNLIFRGELKANKIGRVYRITQDDFDQFIERTKLDYKPQNIESSATA